MDSIPAKGVILFLSRLGGFLRFFSFAERFIGVSLLCCFLPFGPLIESAVSYCSLRLQPFQVLLEEHRSIRGPAEPGPVKLQRRGEVGHINTPRPAQFSSFHPAKLNPSR